MSTFPTKILLATDGSEDAQLAATTAVDVANSTDSELHVVHARLALPWTTGYYSATEPPTTSIGSEEEARQRVLRWLQVRAGVLPLVLQAEEQRLLLE